MCLMILCHLDCNDVLVTFGQTFCKTQLRQYLGMFLTMNALFPDFSGLVQSCKKAAGTIREQGLA